MGEEYVAESIRQFVDQHEPLGQRGPLSADEKKIIGDALEDYLVHDQWRHDLTPSREVLRALVRLRSTAAPPQSRSDAAAVASYIGELLHSLEKREDANMIMREHLAMMSDAPSRS